jgi:conserved hypothetical protein
MITYQLPDEYCGAMRDLDVRAALRCRLAVEHADEIDRTRVVEELGIYGEVRVDVAVLNGAMIGYELKSARDTLKRLPKQVEWYSRVLDQAHIVVADNHLSDTLTIIPAWWGYTVATTSKDGRVTLQDERAAQQNPSIDSQTLALLLWRSEVLAALEERGLDRGYRSKTRGEMARRLAEALTLMELRDLVRETLKTREGWRSTPLIA